jgi:hypothetical protein
MSSQKKNTRCSRRDELERGNSYYPCKRKLIEIGLVFYWLRKCDVLKE